MTSWLRRVVVGATALMLGCNGSDKETQAPPDDGIIFDVPPVGADAVRLVSPTFSVDAGTEVFMCMKIPFEVKEDLFAGGSVVYQPKGGHHSMLYFSPPGQKPPIDTPHECTDADMGNIRFIGVGTADGVGIDLPAGTAMTIPKGATIYTQSHYLNTTDKPIEGQDVVDLRLVPTDQVDQRAGAFTEVDLGLELPAGAETTRQIDCTSPLEMDVPWMIPHMHEWGYHFKIELIVDDVPQTVYETDWSEALRDHFPIVKLDPPVHLRPQDRIRTTCVWHNTEANSLLFPAEMCATFMPFYPSPDGALLACDENGNHFNP